MTTEQGSTQTYEDAIKEIGSEVLARKCRSLIRQQNWQPQDTIAFLDNFLPLVNLLQLERGKIEKQEIETEEEPVIQYRLYIPQFFSLPIRDERDSDLEMFYQRPKSEESQASHVLYLARTGRYISYYTDGGSVVKPQPLVEESLHMSQVGINDPVFLATEGTKASSENPSIFSDYYHDVSCSYYIPTMRDVRFLMTNIWEKAFSGEFNEEYPLEEMVQAIA